MSPTDRFCQSIELRRLAHVQPGYLSRTRVRSSPDGTHLLLQAKDISPKSGLRLDSAARFIPERNADLYRVSRGDILLTARGQDHHAHLIDTDLDDVLASSLFYIIRPRKAAVLPAYLAWYLSQPDAQAALDVESSGTGIGYIARPAIEHLPVVVPPMEMQCRIAEVIRLLGREQALQSRLEKKRAYLIHAICQQALRMEKE